MVKRCIIQPPIIRVSKPGIDVDFATVDDCLVHETMLFAQPYWQTVVNKPGNSDEITIDIPDVTPNPLVMLYPVQAEKSVFPFPRSQSSGNSQSGYPNILNFGVAYKVLSSTRLYLNFYSTNNTQNFTACHVVLLRRPEQ